MNDYLKNIIKSVKQLDTKVTEYKKNTKDLALPSHAFNNWAIELLKSKDDEEALKKLEINVNMGCKNPETFIYLGIYKLKHQEAEDAVEYFLKAIRIDRNNAKAYAFLGSGYCDMQNFEQSKKMFQKSIRLDRRNAHTHLNYALALIKMNEFEEAENEFEKAYLYSSSNFEVLYVWGTFLLECGRWEDAIQKFNVLHKADPFRKEIIYLLAFCHNKIGKHKGAVKYAQKFLIQDKTKLDAYIVLAESYMALGDEEKSVKAFEDALKECPEAQNSFILFLSWGAMLHHFGKLEEAIEKLEKAQNIMPDNFLAPYNLSLIYLRLNDDEKANNALLRTLELNPNHTITLCNMGRFNISKHNYNEAIKYFERANKLKQDKMFDFDLAYCYQMLHDTKNAIKYYEKYLENNPKNIEALTNLAGIYSDMGEKRVALRKIRSAYIENKENVTTIVIYAILLLRAEQIYDAMEKFDEAHKLNSELIYPIFGKCECLIRLNRPKEALKILQEYKEQYSNTQDYLIEELFATVQLYETEKNEEYKNRALYVCDKITSSFGENQVIDKVKENLGEKKD